MFFVLMHSKRSVPHSFYHPTTTTTSSQRNIIICFFFLYIDVEHAVTSAERAAVQNIRWVYVFCVLPTRKGSYRGCAHKLTKSILVYTDFFYMPLYMTARKKTIYVAKVFLLQDDRTTSIFLYALSCFIYVGVNESGQHA